MKKKSQNQGLVYSTDPELMASLETQELEEISTLSRNQQKLKVYLNTKMKPGKKITIVEGFIGKSEDLESLAKQLKTQMGVGGSIQNSEIWLQGDLVNKVSDWLKKQGYKVK